MSATLDHFPHQVFLFSEMTTTFFVLRKIEIRICFDILLFILLPMYKMIVSRQRKEAYLEKKYFPAILPPPTTTPLATTVLVFRKERDALWYVVDGNGMMPIIPYS